MRLRPFQKIGILILFCLFLNIVLPAVFYGFNAIPGTDELMLFNKGKGIASGDISIYNNWDNQELIDPYPPGYPILVAELLTMTPTLSPIDVSYVLRICLLTLTLALYFWIGTLFSRRTAYLAVFFRAVMFQVVSSSPDNYVYIFPTGVFIGGVIFTEICLLLTLIFFIRYFHHQGSDFSNLAIIFVTGLLHGWTHISGFFSSTLFLIILLIGMQIIIIMDRRLLHNWNPKAIFSMVARSKLMMPMYVLMLLPLIIHLTYYSTILAQAFPETYIMDKILPIPIPVFSYLILMSTSFLIGIVGLYFGFIKKSDTNDKVLPMFFFAGFKVRRILVAAYLLCFVGMIIASTLNPALYAYSSFAGTTGYPSALPAMDPVPVLSYTVGLVLFVLASYGMLKMINNKDEIRRFFAFFYLGSYYFFSILWFLDLLNPHKAMFFMLIIPFLIGGSLMTFSSRSCNILGKIIHTSSDMTKYASKIAAFVVVMFIIIAIVSRANSEPTIREDFSTNQSILSFGTLSLPIVTFELLDAVKEFQIPGIAILSSSVTQIALYTFIPMKPLCPSYNTLIYPIDNVKWNAWVSALFYFGSTPADWLHKNNGTLVVIGYLDAHGDGRSIGGLIPPIDKMMNDASLRLVWQDSLGQKIFQLNST
jgi:hypothetical protein